MATAEADTSRDEQVPPGGSVYDGFISYSHAADDLLAPRLQAALQRFAKPWWKRRALRIFRDESSLSANPHLWSSITGALDRSDWFVLLLSPDAAGSLWVNQEVEYWLEHKDPDRIIPVVTDGEFRWAETDIDLESDAVPPALYGAFSDEPRWVDLRFARSEEQLDLNNPRFSAVVADIASAIRQVPKDELESEEVRQHRRTVRTAWAAGIVVLVFAILSGVAALFALDQRNEAQTNAQAEVEARTEAVAQREAAEQQTAIAEARELAARAENLLDFDPELSAHLAIAALASLRDAGVDTAQAVSVLRAAIADDRVTFRVPGGDFVAAHPSGSLLATSEGNGVAVWDIATRQVVERYKRDGATAIDASFSPDGGSIAVSFAESAPAVTVWDRTTRDSFDLGSDAPGSAARLEFSPDGSLLAFGAFNWEGFVPDFVQTEIWSVDALRVVHEGLGSGADFNVGGLLSFAAQDESGATSIVVFDPESGDTLQTIPVDFDAFFTSWSPNSAQIAVANRFTAAVFDVEEKLEIARADADRVWRPEWLSSGDAFFVGGTSIPKVIDAASGEVRMELRGQAGGTFDYDLVADTYSVASAGFRTSPAGTVIFDTSPPGAAEVAGWESELSGRLVARYVSDGSEVFLGAGDSYLTAHALDGSNSRVTQSSGNPGWFPNVDENGEFVGYATADGPSVVRSLETEAVVYEAPDGWTIRGVSPDRTHAVIKEGGGLDCAPIRLVAIQDDESTDLPIPCIGSAWFSPNGRYMVAGNAVPTGEAVVFDTETAEVVADLAGTPYGGLAGGFTSDSTKMIIGSLDGPVFVLDMATLASEGPVAGAVDLEIPAHDALVIIVRVSPDGSKVATAAFEGPLRVWDLTNNGQLLGEFGEEFFNSGDFHPTEPHLLVASPPNLVRIHSFNLDELIAIAEARLSRDMTAAECDQYFRDPCPTS